MKKLTVIVTLCLLLMLAACGGNDAPDAGADTMAGTADTAAQANPTADATQGAPVLNAEPKPEGETDPLDAETAEGAAPEEGERPAGQPAAITEAPAPKQEPKSESKPEPKEEKPEAVQEKPAEKAPAPEPTAATAEEASAYIGKDVSSLLSALGNPLNRTYAPSCLGEGEDGELTYSGFTVYTYREGDSEKVQAVE